MNRAPDLHMPAPVAALGHVRKLVPHENYGIVVTDDGRELRFTRIDVPGARFNFLREGARVRVGKSSEGHPRGVSFVEPLR